MMRRRRKMTGSKEVTGMKRMDWFSPERVPRNWYRQPRDGLYRRITSPPSSVSL